MEQTLEYYRCREKGTIAFHECCGKGKIREGLVTAVDLSWTLEENKISTGRRRGAAFLRGARGAFGEEGTGREPDGRHGSRRLRRWDRQGRVMRDAGERRAGVRLERALRN